MWVDPVEVYRSAQLARCDDRAFMLIAVGIPSAIGFDGEGYHVYVEASQAAAAQAHLARYEQESQPPPRPPPQPRSWPRAWVGSAVYVLVLYGVSWAIAHGVGRLDAFWLGDLDAARLRQGEWWRALTALTLHLDVAHFAGNLGFGALFGYLAGRRLGPGSAWLLIVLAAAAANLLGGWLGPAEYRAAGASTAVFAALGVLAAYEWADRSRAQHRHGPQRRIARWGPLIAGLILLGLLGSGTGAPDDTTDLVAHVGGFGFGALCGAVAARASVRRALERLPQWLSGLVALAAVLLAWALALLSAPAS